MFSRRLLLQTAVMSLASTRAHGSRRFGLTKRRGRHVLTDPSGAPFVPLGVNHIQEIDRFAEGQPARLAQVHREVLENLRDWGFNAGGYGTPRPLQDELPFFAQFELTRAGHYLSPARFVFDDVFDPAFVATAKQKIAAVVDEHRGRHNLLGYYWTDTPRWDLELARKTRGDDWVSALRRLPADKPGKRRYLAFLRETYRDDIARFREAYALDVPSFEALGSLEMFFLDRDRPAVRRDDRAFLRLIARQLYRTTGEALRALDDTHLVFGDRYKLGDLPDEVLEEALPHIDVLSIQPGPERGPAAGPGEEERVFPAAAFDRLHRLSGKPLIVCDHNLTLATPARPVPLWHSFASVDPLLAAYERYLQAALSRPYVVGYFRCQYVDKMVNERAALKQGLLDEQARPRRVITDRLKAVHRRVLERING